MAKEKAKSFILYNNYLNQFRLLSMEDRGRLITAIFEYADDQTILTELSDLAKMAFSCMKDTLDRDREAYIAKCAKNAENGRKGGKAKKNIFSENSERLKNEANQAYNDNDNGNGNCNENKNDNDIDNGNGIGNGNDIAQANAPLDNAPHSSAPTALRETPSLKEEEKEELFLKGIPEEYISEREERASEFARKTKRSTYSVIVEWWESDKRSSKWNNGRASPVSSLPSSHGKSYDLDDFFAASLRRSYDEFDAKYGKD